MASDFPSPRIDVSFSVQKLPTKGIIKNDQTKQGNEQNSRKIRGTDQEHYEKKVFGISTFSFYSYGIFLLVSCG